MKILKVFYLAFLCGLCVETLAQKYVHSAKIQGIRIDLEQNDQGIFLTLKNLRFRSIYFDSTYFDFRIKCGKELEGSFGSAYHGSILLNEIEQVHPFKTARIKLFCSHRCADQAVSGRLFWINKKDLKSYLKQENRSDENIYTDIIDFYANRVELDLTNDSLQLGWW